VAWFFGKLEQQKKVIALQEKYKGSRVFDWFQGTEKGVWKTGGICAAMVMDWLRRKYLGKKNYDDPKYKSTVKNPGSFSLFTKGRDFVMPEGNEKRDKLMTRVLNVQVGYGAALSGLAERLEKFKQSFREKNNRDPTPEEVETADPELAMFDANPDKVAFAKALAGAKKIPRGYDKLRLSDPVRLRLVEVLKDTPSTSVEAEITFFILTAFAGLVGPPEIGLYLGLNFSKGAHAIGVYYNKNVLDPKYQNRNWVVFDPNFGEYGFQNAGDATEFLTELCNAMYSNDIKTLESSLVHYLP
jgi:hypothetical protein